MSRYQQDIRDDYDDCDEYGLDKADVVPSRWQQSRRMKVGADPSRLPSVKKQFIKPNIQIRPPQLVQQFYEDNEIKIKDEGKMVPQPFIEWKDTQFPAKIMKVIQENKFKMPTPIQAIVFPIILAGNDVIGIAQTGSGKTIAYLLPGLIHITNQKIQQEGKGPQMLILAPTRELAMQIHLQVKEFAKNFDLKTACIFGGIQNRNSQSNQLEGYPDIIVACPGRLIDFLRERKTTLSDVTYLVIDEADRMLDMGFEKDVRHLVEQIRSDRQTTFFSATWPRAVRELANDFCQENPIYIQIGRSNLTINKDINQIVICLFQNQKLQQLMDILDSLVIQDKVLIFAETRVSCERLARNLTSEGYYAIALHGDKTQVQRDSIMHAFKTSDTRLLCATDLASRGLDVSDITVVINYDFPRQFDDYIHRIGRTGRAHRKGRAFSFLAFDKDEPRMAKELIKLLKAANPNSEVSHLEKFAQGNFPIRNQIQNGKFRDDQLLNKGGAKKNFIVPNLSDQDYKLYYDVEKQQQQQRTNGYQDDRNNNYQGRPQQNRGHNNYDNRGPQTRYSNNYQQNRNNNYRNNEEQFYNSEFQHPQNNRRNDTGYNNTDFGRGGNERNFVPDAKPERPLYGKADIAEPQQKPIVSDFNRGQEYIDQRQPYNDQRNNQRPDNGSRYGFQNSRQNDNDRGNGQRFEKNFNDRRYDNQRYGNNDGPRYNDGQRQNDGPRYNDGNRFNDGPRQNDGHRFHDGQRNNNGRFTNDYQKPNNYGGNQRPYDQQRQFQGNTRSDDHENFYNNQRNNGNSRNFNNDRNQNNRRFDNNDRNDYQQQPKNDDQRGYQRSYDQNNRFQENNFQQQRNEQPDFNDRRGQNERQYEQPYAVKEQTQQINDDVSEGRSNRPRKKFDESIMEQPVENNFNYNPNKSNSDESQKISVHSKQSIPREERVLVEDKEELNNSQHSNKQNEIRREEGGRFQEESRWDNQDRRNIEPQQFERQTDNRRDQNARQENQVIQRNERIQDNQEGEDQFDFFNYQRQVQEQKKFDVAYEPQQQGKPVINSRKNSNENQEDEQKDSQINY